MRGSDLYNLRMDWATLMIAAEPTTRYRIHQQVPTLVHAPASVDELADIIKAARVAGQALVPWGGGTRQQIGAPPLRYDAALDLRHLNRVIEYSPADLVISVAAGATLGEVQTLLAQHGQWLPWDPPLPAQATLGGLLATAASGPLRLGYGAPRDWTLGMQVVLGDGRVVRSGARVVKNVAGYDSHKLHIGALGTLGVISEVTFKVAPLPADRQTLLAVFPDRRDSVQAVEQLRMPPLQPIALVALSDQAQAQIAALDGVLPSAPPHILVAARFAGAPGAVRRQIYEAARRCVEFGAQTLELALNDDTAFWTALADVHAPQHDASLLVRVGAPVSALMEMARQMERIPMQYQLPSARVLLAGVGVGYTRWYVASAAPDALIAALTVLRQEMQQLGGYAVVEELPAALIGQIDRWGEPPTTLALMQALRNQWDPAHTLNPGRYLVD